MPTCSTAHPNLPSRIIEERRSRAANNYSRDGGVPPFADTAKHIRKELRMREPAPRLGILRTGERLLAALSAAALSLVLGGCVGAPALRESVLAYDETTHRLDKEIMLLNIARMSERGNPHFTVTGSIAATFDFTTNAAVGGSLERPGANALNLNWGASASENPTFQIIPVTGEEFTKRIVEPLTENVFATIAFQGIDVEQIARLLSWGIEVQKSDGRFERFILNNPSVPNEYEEFRRFAMHLAWLQRNRHLFLSVIKFNRMLLDRQKSPPPLADLVKNDGLKYQQAPDGSYTVTQSVRGRVLLSNYDPRTLTDAERNRLNELAEENPVNFVMIDLRPEYPGGDFPMFGAFKLRSLIAVLRFIGEGIESNPEFDVTKDPRTRGEVVSPTRTLEIHVTDGAPTADVPTVAYKGHNYWVGDTKWDRTEFFLLNLIFQFTVTKSSNLGIPITISK
jgi:hypothetical protein